MECLFWVVIWMPGVFDSDQGSSSSSRICSIFVAKQVLKSSSRAARID